MALVEIDFACNDERGLDTGQAEAIEIGDLRLVGGSIVLKRIGPRHVRVGRLKLLFGHYKYGVGNWCWDGYWLTKSETLRLINYLEQQKYWHCEEAPEDHYEKFNGKQPFNLSDLEDLLDPKPQQAAASAALPGS